jgi:hypothetical protein
VGSLVPWENGPAMDCTPGEAIRIERKFREHGWDSLDPEERDCLRAALREIDEMWQGLSPEQKEKYGDWTLDQLYAIKRLIDERDADEPGITVAAPREIPPRRRCSACRIAEGKSLRTIRPSSEDEMVLAFLRAERFSPRHYALYLEPTLAALGLSTDIIDQADISNSEQNTDRHDVLGAYRGFDATTLFSPHSLSMRCGDA